MRQNHRLDPIRLAGSDDSCNTWSSIALPRVMTLRPRALSGTAFATLLLIALMMGANHVAARLAFNHGVDVATAATFRSMTTALVVTALVLIQGVSLRLTHRHRRFLPLIGLLIGVQGLCLYSAVARLPVALALLAFNSYPLWAAVWDRLLYQRQPEPVSLLVYPQSAPLFVPASQAQTE